VKNPIPLIGITTYHRDERGYIQLPAQYADAVRRAGGIPLLIQPGEPQVEALLELLDGMILSGGGDVDPSLYTDEIHEQVYWVNQDRDAFEISLTRRLLDQATPTFYFCRGLQILNVALGGTLLTHIPDAVQNAVDPRPPPRDPILHDVTLRAGSRLGSIMQQACVTTASWHHQSIDKLAPGLEVVGNAPDGVIEAVEMPNNPNLIAVQWHPELTAHEDPTQQRLFDELVRMTRPND
jgi:putative glutamine amidotransferase